MHPHQWVVLWRHFQKSEWISIDFKYGFSLVWVISERITFWYENETNYTVHTLMYNIQMNMSHIMWHVPFVKHKSKQSPFSDRCKWSIHNMYAQKSFICHESYSKCKLLFLYFLLFSRKFCTNMYARYNNTSRKFGDNMSSGFYIYNEKSENRCNILKLAQTIRAKSRWTASPSFIHPFTALTLIFWRFSDGIVIPNSCIQM